MEDHKTPTKKAADPRKMTVNLFVHHKYSALYGGMYYCQKLGRGIRKDRIPKPNP